MARLTEGCVYPNGKQDGARPQIPAQLLKPSDTAKTSVVSRRRGEYALAPSVCADLALTGARGRKGDVEQWKWGKACPSRCAH